MVAPAVSVVVPVFNGEAHLREAVASVLGQTLRDLEVVLVDDGSTDGSADIIRDLAASDRRIRTLFGTNAGAASATNAGLRIARGHWVARLDQDDILVPERFETQLEWMERQRIDVCGTQVEVFGTESRILWFPESPGAVRDELIFRPAIMQPATMRRELALANPYADGAVFDDYELLTRLAPGYELANLPTIGLRHRRHPGQTQSVARTRLLQDLRRYRFRYFYERFPGTPIESYLPLAHLAERRPFSSVREFSRAGRWLVDLAASGEPGLRRRMARRWQTAWEASSPLLPSSAAEIHASVLTEIDAGSGAIDDRSLATASRPD